MTNFIERLLVGLDMKYAARDKDGHNLPTVPSFHTLGAENK
jgi:hypothetical protein